MFETLNAACWTPASTSTRPYVDSVGLASATTLAARVAAMPARITSRCPAWSASQANASVPATVPATSSPVKTAGCEAGACQAVRA
jgi:hypothetical protein